MSHPPFKTNLFDIWKRTQFISSFYLQSYYRQLPYVDTYRPCTCLKIETLDFLSENLTSLRHLFLNQAVHSTESSLLNSKILFQTISFIQAEKTCHFFTGTVPTGSDCLLKRRGRIRKLNSNPLYENVWEPMIFLWILPIRPVYYGFLIVSFIYFMSHLSIFLKFFSPDPCKELCKTAFTSMNFMPNQRIRYYVPRPAIHQQFKIFTESPRLAWVGRSFFLKQAQYRSWFNLPLTLKQGCGAVPFWRGSGSGAVNFFRGSGSGAGAGSGSYWYKFTSLRQARSR